MTVHITLLSPLSKITKSDKGASSVPCIIPRHTWLFPVLFNQLLKSFLHVAGMCAHMHILYVFIWACMYLSGVCQSAWGQRLVLCIFLDLQGLILNLEPICWWWLACSTSPPPTDTSALGLETYVVMPSVTTGAEIRIRSVQYFIHQTFSPDPSPSVFSWTEIPHSPTPLLSLFSPHL